MITGPWICNLTTDLLVGMVSNVAFDTRKVAVLICERVSLWFRAKKMLLQTTSNGGSFRGCAQSIDLTLAPKTPLGRD